jgi:hypothetical protein
MKTRQLLALLAVALLAGLLIGCTEEPPPSLYDSNYVSGPQPKVTAIAPATNALAGVTTLTITGENFNSDPAKNMVFFGAATAKLSSATATQLILKAPVVIGDSIKVKVAVQGADLFSTPYLYKLEAPTEDKFGNFGANDEVASMDCDTAGNVFVSMLSSGLGTGVWRFTPDGTKGTTVYSNPFSGAVGSWKGMKFGPGGAIFCVAARAIVFRIPPGGGNAAVWVSGSGLSNLNDLDFDASGNIWTSGTAAASIFRIKQDKSVQAFPFVGTVRAVRVYNGYLYVGGLRDSLEKVWRFPITGDNLGTEEEYFNVSGVYGANSFGVYGLAFDTNGNMYIGTDAADGILLVNSAKQGSPYYPGILSAATVYLTWGKGANLFQGKGGTTKTIVKINTQKASAPYYGRTLP